MVLLEKSWEKYDKTVGLKTNTTGVERQIFGTSKNCLQQLHYPNYLGVPL